MPQNSDVNYERFFELSRDMMCIVNIDGYFVKLNKSFGVELGFEIEYLLSQPIVDLIHPDDVDKTNTELAKLSQGDITLNFINRYKHIDGHYLTFSWNAQTDPESRLVFAVARNITSQINQTLRLNQIEDLLFKETIIGITDVNGVITEVNDNFCKISGYSRDELIGNTHNLINSGFHSKEFFASMWKTLCAKKTWSDVIKNMTKDGNYYYVNTIITPILDHQNNISSYLAIRQDVSAVYHQKTEIEKTLNILNETNSIAKIGGWELDVTTGELTWTDETFRILDVVQQSEQKPSLLEGLRLYTKECQPLIKSAISRAIEYGTPYSMELEAQTLTGKKLWVYTSGKANYKDGKVVSLSGTIQDIDLRKKTEFGYNLEKQKAIQSAKFASLGELAASMAHEINNPLGIISGYTQLILRSENFSEKTSSQLEGILKSCDRISHIVSSLKKFSRSDTETLFSKESLTDIVKDAISLARSRIKRERIEIKFVANEKNYISCNNIEIEQVVLNMLNNAIDAIKILPEKWIKLTIQQQDSSIELCIIDSGTGINRETQQKLFTPFYTTKEIGFGTGLGLSISESILKEHNATLVYDATNTNTCFRINFPITE